jgi:hypothetical protein
VYGTEVIDRIDSRSFNTYRSTPGLHMRVLRFFLAM